jgi:PEGA domain
MRHRALALIALLSVALLPSIAAARAGGSSATTPTLPMKGPPSGAAAGRAQQGPLFQDGTYLVIEVTPPDAHVYLDGRWLGSAATLSRGQIPILPGKRTIAVIRPGYRPYVTEFIARPVGIPTRFRVVLVPDRSP